MLNKRSLHIGSSILVLIWLLVPTPHVLQGYEVYKEKHIFYSLGNFLFGMPTEETRYSAIVNIDVDDRRI